MGGILYDIINNPQIWLTIILTTYACILPDIIIRRWEVLFSKDIINNLRYKNYEGDFIKKSYIKKIEEVGRFTRFITKFRKMFTKSGEYEPENLTDKKFKAVVDGFRSSRKERKTIQMKIETMQKEANRMLPSDERQGNYVVDDNNIYNNNAFNILHKNETNNFSNRNDNSRMQRDSNYINNLNENNLSKMNSQGQIRALKQNNNNNYQDSYMNNQNLINNNKITTSPTSIENNNNLNFLNNKRSIHPLDEDVSLDKQIKKKYSSTKSKDNKDKKILIDDYNESYENLYNINNNFENKNINDNDNDNNYHEKINGNINNKFDFEIEHFKKNDIDNVNIIDDIVQRENNKFDIKINKFNDNINNNYSDIENKKNNDYDIVLRENNNKFDFKINKFSCEKNFNNFNENENENEINKENDKFLNIENLQNLNLEENDLMSAGKLVEETVNREVDISKEKERDVDIDIDKYKDKDRVKDRIIDIDISKNKIEDKEYNYIDNINDINDISGKFYFKYKTKFH
jgi:hypothetical protein